MDLISISIAFSFPIKKSPHAASTLKLLGIIRSKYRSQKKILELAFQLIWFYKKPRKKIKKPK
jgi:hypothetical protein